MMTRYIDYSYGDSLDRNACFVDSYFRMRHESTQSSIIQHTRMSRLIGELAAYANEPEHMHAFPQGWSGGKFASLML